LKRSIPYLYIHILLAILFIQFVPAFQNLFTARIEFTEPMIAHLGKLVLKLFTSLRLPSIHLLQCPFHLTKPPGYLLLIFGPAVIIADRFRNLRQIALPLAGNNSLRLNIFGRLGIGVPTGFPAQAIMTVNLIYQSLKESVDSFVIKLRSYGRINGHIRHIFIPFSAIALHLLSDITKSIKRAFLFKFIKYYQ